MLNAVLWFASCFQPHPALMKITSVVARCSRPVSNSLGSLALARRVFSPKSRAFLVASPCQCRNAVRITSRFLTARWVDVRRSSCLSFLAVAGLAGDFDYGGMPGPGMLLPGMQCQSLRRMLTNVSEEVPHEEGRIVFHEWVEDIAPPIAALRFRSLGAMLRMSFMTPRRVRSVL